MIYYKPIGLIRSPFTEAKGTPIQAVAAQDIVGSIEVAPEYVAGLKDIEGFYPVSLSSDNRLFVIGKTLPG